MKKDKESVFFAIFVFLLVPYLITVIYSGREACPVSKEITMEEYLPAVTASEISWNYDKAAIEAQTVIARGNLYLKWREGEQEEILEEASKNLKKRDMRGEELKKFQKFQKAAVDTRGKVLALEGAVKNIPYHALSQGRTRDGKEVLGEGFSYLPSVETEKDIESPLYIQGRYFSVKELEKAIQDRYPGFSMGEEKTGEIQAADSAGYVMEVRLGNQEFQGERIKEILNLPSSCFTIQILGDEFRFLCKGIGHGMGMSQYTAQEMAKEGKNFEEILKYFFPELQLGEIK